MSQIARKFIQDNAINGIKFRLDNADMLRARNAANSADINILRVTSSDKIEFQQLPEALSSLPIPTGAKQFATIEYINNYVAGKGDPKDAVDYLRDTNLAGTFTAGSGGNPATMTGAVQLVIDGKSFTGADVTTPKKRIALTAQTTGLQNGVFELTAATASSYTLTRAPDFDQLSDAAGTEVTTGAYFSVTSGTVYSGYECILSTPDPITIDTTSLTFVKYPSALSITGGDMIVKNGNDFAVDLATNGGLESTNPGNAAGQLRVKTRTGDLEKDRTVQLDASGNVVAQKFKKTLFTLSSTDITNQYLDLADVAADSSIMLRPAGAGEQIETIDFTVNYTGGTSSKSRVTLAGGLASGGVSALAAGDQVELRYGAF